LSDRGARRDLPSTLPELTIAELQTRMDEGASSSVWVCERMLERIEAIDRTGPTLRSVIELDPDALPHADALDDERKERGPRSPLHGVPILLKDSIDTADAMMTTAGSLAMEGNYAPDDAFLVTRLRDAGALILGKTNMSEWGYMRSTRGCSGWSSRGGQVRNPYVLDRSPSGSSSGSAVAVAANLCTAAIGAEVDGSIVRPASINGIVGIKPTVGLVSSSGIIGVAEPQDTAGPMARCVADAAALLSVIAGEDPRDPATRQAGARRAADYGDALDVRALEGARLGVARECFTDHEGTNAVMEEALMRLVDLGAEVLDPVPTGGLPLFGEPEMTLLLFGLKASLDRYLATHPGAGIRSLAELIEYNRAHADRVMPHFRQELFELAQTKGSLDDAVYLRAQAECRRRSRDEGIDKALREHRLDALVAPTDG